MATQQSSTPTPLPQPLRAAVSALRRVPGAGLVGRAAGGTLDRIGAMSPRGRRMAVYTGAGVLGVAGVVEWPVALTGAAVAWLTQPRPGELAGAAAPARPAAAGAAGRETTGAAHRVGGGRREAAGAARREAAPDGPGAGRHESATARSAAKNVAKTATLSASHGSGVHHHGTRARRTTASPTRTRLAPSTPDTRTQHGEE
ncbi:hypothetical protein ACFWII_33260 [Streptomyces sp. NPDC127063]|uniref:hypothetical protein n=1 Tax=Streptomyces sp. NPDC127063 TaxID=3347123 RepID=UPI00364C5567